MSQHFLLSRAAKTLTLAQVRRIKQTDGGLDMGEVGSLFRDMTFQDRYLSLDLRDAVCQTFEQDYVFHTHRMEKSLSGSMDFVLRLRHNTARVWL